MIIIINSSKTLEFDRAASVKTYSRPEFLADAETLVSQLRHLSVDQFSKLMGVSAKLARLNVERYAQWQTPVNPSIARQALLVFSGDVYNHIDVNHYRSDEFVFAQKHLRILSGLYGILRPLDLIQAYRLEMGTKLATSRGKNLVAFWGTQITESLNAALKKDKSGTLLNLVSDEYFKVVQPDRLKAQIVKPVFKEYKDEKFKIVAIYAKRARGAMCNYIIRNRITECEALKAFNWEGYRFNSKLSTQSELVFTRKK
jgi:hypothetical protein